jgi:hypothetical protein
MIPKSLYVEWFCTIKIAQAFSHWQSSHGSPQSIELIQEALSFVSSVFCSCINTWQISLDSWKNWLESSSILETTLIEEKNIKIPVHLFIRRRWIPLFRIFMLIWFFLYEHLTSHHVCLKQNPSRLGPVKTKGLLHGVHGYLFDV